jgi:predicted ATPase/DNA-binding winged helix-turn-helix (wHTH) protein
MLILLVERAGEIVDKRELLERVWPHSIVEDGTLRFHMSGLRKALGDGVGGARYVTTICGRGYCFVAQLRLAGEATDLSASAGTSTLRPVPRRMVGREADVEELAAVLNASRFVTIVGPGGIGKTTIAMTIADGLSDASPEPARLVDLASISDADLVPALIASAVGFAAHTTDLIPALLTFLRDRSIVIILDSCEHLVEAAACLAEQIAAVAPGITILATSREPLGAEGERIHRLLPLALPRTDDRGEDARRSPAVQLLVDRASASGAVLTGSETETDYLVHICRRLDGIPLAIELAAGRVAALGVAQTAALLDARLLTLVNGRRTALPRHQTLIETLDWSYDLLSQKEQAGLRRLAIFVGGFSFEAAHAVADLDLAEETIAQLVGKSLVSADLLGAEARYRLLDTTRSCLLAKLSGTEEASAMARRHAEFFLASLERRGTGTEQADGLTGHILSKDDLGNVRAALDWSFGARGDPLLATALTAAAAPFLVEMSLFGECRRWTELALSALDEDMVGTCREIELRISLGHALMFTEGNSIRVKEEMLQGLALARSLQAPLHELRLLAGLHLFHVRTARHNDAIEFAEAAETLAARLGNAAVIAASESCVGLSRHLMGNHKLAGARLRSSLARTRGLPKTIRFGMDHRVPAQMALARQLWTEGFGDQAAALAEQTLRDAKQLGRSVILSIAFILGIKLQVWLGRSTVAADWTSQLISHAALHSLTPYHSVGLALEGEQISQHGPAEEGVARIESAIETLHRINYGLVTTDLLLAVASGRLRSGHHRQSLEAADAALERIEQTGDCLYLPEALRIRGEVLAAQRGGAGAEAERCLVSAAACARRQSALAFELRAVTSLAQLLVGGGRYAEAQDVLAPVHARFREGFGSGDLKVAAGLLADLGRNHPTSPRRAAHR